MEDMNVQDVVLFTTISSRESPGSLLLLTPHRILHRASYAALGCELFADGALFVKWTTNLLGGTAKCAVLLQRRSVCRSELIIESCSPVNCLPMAPLASKTPGLLPVSAVAGVLISEAMPPFPDVGLEAIMMYYLLN